MRRPVLTLAVLVLLLAPALAAAAPPSPSSGCSEACPAPEPVSGTFTLTDDVVAGVLDFSSPHKINVGTISCVGACGVEATATSGTTVVATGTATKTKSGKATLYLSVNKAGEQAFKYTKSVPVTLALSFGADGKLPVAQTVDVTLRYGHAPFTPLPGSRTVKGPGGVKLSVPPKTITCAQHQSRSLYLIIGAQFTQAPRKGGASTVETLQVKGPYSKGALPHYLLPDGSKWVYDGLLVSCGATYTVRYVVELGNKTPRPRKRVEFTVTIGS